LDPQTIYDLIQKYKNNTASSAEKQQLLDWYRSTAYRDAQFPTDEKSANQYILNRLPKEIRPQSKITVYRNWSIAAASVILACWGLSEFALKPKNDSPGQKIVYRPKNDIAPGGNKAILTLANGAKVSLTDIKQGAIVKQNNVQIIKSANGQVTYSFQPTSSPPTNGGNGGGAEAVLYNTIETPPGGQFKIELPDGTLVWLNALSSLKFPLNFSSLKERKVELTGEAYFEVVHNKDLPFRVVTSTQIVEDLGTLFDVNAYADEKHARTTLVKGSVMLESGSNKIILRPGQQAIAGQTFIVHEVDTETVTAWKSGYFKFDDEKLEDIMRQMARWYGIKVVYLDESVKSKIFGVMITRFTNISTLLNMLEQTGTVKFSISGKTVTISKR